MRSRRRPEGKLIALEGTRGRDVADGAERLWRRLHRKAGADSRISRWNASRLFDEMPVWKRNTAMPSPRTVILLYASDLLFRLRWEIRPALRAGRSVIAAPYVETAMAFGAAAGLPPEWISSVLRFAPAPQVCCRIKERKKWTGWKDGALDGFMEFCSTALGGSPDWNPVTARQRAIEYLDKLEERGTCERLRRETGLR